MKVKNISVLISAIFISACSSMTYTTKQETTEKNKSLVTEIKCVLIDACNAKATELCADGYNVISTSESIPYVLNKMEISCKTKAPSVVKKKEETKMDNAIIEIEKEMKEMNEKK
ncbi:hypothetical protein [Candidatus Methylopumilus rimovensis]|jgi:hypothetical protein|uniref:hypothetical protein n=1 Tax=Candidatus Methylopumilus rimovensis TaxID=2588535 RepID=UPI00111D3D0F|nr:hypothetical protein [Candidatus Methylopumilus rimovensis]QDD11631.1 hypothetical protein FIT62_00340 [Candidatus Methylopumilus rimovensis]